MRDDEERARDEHVPASIVARALGWHRRTVIRWIEAGHLEGGRFPDQPWGRWYVMRSAFEALRDRGKPGKVTAATSHTGGHHVS